MQIATARPDSERLRRDIFSAYSQIAELQARCEAQFKELDSVEDELDAKKCLVMDKDYEIITLTNKVNQLEYEFATWAERCAAERRDNEKLQRDLAAFSSHIADLEQRYDAQVIHNELQIETSQLEHTITFLTTTFTHAQSEERAEAEQFATARRDLEHLRRLLSTQTIIVGEHGGDELSIEHTCTGALEQRMQAFRLISSLSRVNAILPAGIGPSGSGLGTPRGGTSGSRTPDRRTPDELRHPVQEARLSSERTPSHQAPG